MRLKTAVHQSSLNPLMNKPTVEDLFTDMSPEQAQTLSGGRRRRGGMLSSRCGLASGGMDSGYGYGGSRFYFDLQAYIFGIGAAYLFGNPGVTPQEVQYVWQRSLWFW